ETGVEYLCMAGGVALNCVGNGRILREGPFKGIWIHPAAGDAGGAVGAALSAWYRYDDQPRVLTGVDRMSGSYLGPRHTNAEIEQFIKQVQGPYWMLEDETISESAAIQC